MKKESVSGLVYGRLTVLAEAGSNKFRHRLVECICQCGNKTITALGNLKNGETQSCGCIKQELDRSKASRIKELGLHKGMLTHGQSAIPEYKIWCAMKVRCSSPRHAAFHRYGGRGITVCDRWLTFENFIEDMGLRPSRDYTIERLDNDGNYTPENCEWKTRLEQNRNKSSNHWITLNGETMVLADWARKLGIRPYVLCNRISKGWPIEAVLTGRQRPITKLNVPIEHAGLSMTLKQWAKHTGIRYQTLWARLKSGWPIEHALETAICKK